MYSTIVWKSSKISKIIVIEVFYYLHIFTLDFSSISAKKCLICRAGLLNGFCACQQISSSSCKNSIFSSDSLHLHLCLLRVFQTTVSRDLSFRVIYYKTHLVPKLIPEIFSSDGFAISETCKLRVYLDLWPSAISKPHSY